ncbi:MAG TPA: SUMF1/EgtB/PvdO family nonheme iron enzyme [Ktedonobacterales bacterium]
MTQTNVFIGHTSLDVAIALRVADELNRLGCRVVLQSSSGRRKDYTDLLAKALPRCQWFVLVQSPAAARAKSVQTAVIQARQLMEQGIIQGMFAIIADAPGHRRLDVPEWRDIRAFDATVNFQRACAQLCNALQLGPVQVPSILPPALGEIGFTASAVEGVEVITPPVTMVAGGPFLMGSNPERDAFAAEHEMPQRLVTLPPYAIALYPLTVAEYACFLAATHHWKPGFWDDQMRHPTHPVVSISWYDMRDYSRWLSERTSQHWRLPTDAEWEKAARGDDGRIYPWGDAFDVTAANVRETGHCTTTPVGAFPKGKSPSGIYEMAGNVWEWTTAAAYSSDANRSHAEHPTAVDAPESAPARGGSWEDTARFARAACRVWLETVERFHHVGGRLVMVG